MEIQIFKQSTATPAIWNHEELKAEISAKMEGYKNLVFTEETQADAKRYRANLNKLIDAIAGFVREEKKKALAEFEETTKKQADELLAIIIPCRDAIDVQEKAISDFKRKEKQSRIIEEIYTPMIGNLAALVPYERLHDPKWLNVTCSERTIGEEMGKKIDNIFAGMAAIDRLNLTPDMAEQVKSVFLRNFDLAAAIAEKDRIEAEREALKRYTEAQQAVAADEPHSVETAPVQAETPTAPQGHPAAGETTYTETTYTVTFRIRVTREQLDGLGAYMKAHNIKPERV